MRIILYTGKGGVGKTSIAAATGLKLADLGYKTIVMSLDAAHSLSDAFDKEKRLTNKGGQKQIQINDKLWVQEIDVQEAIEDHWANIHSYVQVLLNQSGLEEIVAEEIAIFPGMEEICSLLYINQYVRERAYDVIILDCAPTGESLRFVSTPTTLEWYMNRLFKLERSVMKAVRPVVERISSVPLPGDDYFQNIEDLFEQIRGIDRILNDPKITSVRLVTNPEKIVIKETQRAFMYFCLYGFCIDAVIINRIIPEGVTSPFFEIWKQTQQAYIDEALNYFSEVPVWKVPLFDDEVVGEKGLIRLAEALYADIDPADVFFDERPYQFNKNGNQYQISISLGDRNNQNFVSLPHARFVSMLTYKAQLVGIKVLITEESYTSKCSFLDLEPVKKQLSYLGQRIKRGLFRSRTKRLINADVNGALNIIRKVASNAFGNGVEGVVVHPVKVTL